MYITIQQFMNYLLQLVSSSFFMGVCSENALQKTLVEGYVVARGYDGLPVRPEFLDGLSTVTSITPTVQYTKSH